MKEGFDPAGLSNELMLALPDVGWVSVNTMGCTASIEVAEKIQAPEITDTGTPTNVVASFAGQVLRMEIFGGGSGGQGWRRCHRGAALIRGVVENEAGETSFQHASGS